MNILALVRKVCLRKTSFIFSLLILGDLVTAAEPINKTKVVSAQVIVSAYTSLGAPGQSKMEVQMNRMHDTLTCDFINRTNDTIYLYGTTYNENFVYNKNIIKEKNKQMVIDLSEMVPHPNTYVSGMKQYQFYVVPPNYSLDFILSISKIKKTVNLKRNQQILVKFSYYDQFEIYSQKDNIITGCLGSKKYIEQKSKID